VTELPRERCAACGETFGCGATVGDCWCNEVEIAPERAAVLKLSYETCLCPRCLVQPESTGAVEIRRVAE
jgi:hypothetical protein